MNGYASRHLFGLVASQMCEACCLLCVKYDSLGAEALHTSSLLGARRGQSLFFVCVCFFEIGFFCIVLTVLELTL